MATAEQERREVRAEAKWVRSSARKARLVVDHIRGRTVPEARTVLAFSQRAVAREVQKQMRHGAANAEANHGLVGDDLVVASVYVDEGPTIKRWRARARGRVARIKKRTCHITVKLVENPKAPPRTPPRAAKPEAAQEKPKRAPRAKKTDTATATEKPKRAPRKKKEATA